MCKWKKGMKRFVMALFFVMSLTAVSFVSEAKTVKPTGITLNYNVYTLKKGRKLRLKKTIYPSNTSKKKKKVVWSSSKKSVAKVSKNGVVKARKKGRATITVRIKGTHLKAKCRIIVGTPVKKVSLNKSSASLNQGKKLQLKATISPKNATTKTVKWKSSNTSVATVSSKGLVLAKNPGTAIIYAITKDGSGKQAKCTITVPQPVKVQSVKFSRSVYYIALGQSSNNIVTIASSNADNKVLHYTSANPAIATVGEDGTVTGKALGTTTITARTTDGSGITMSYQLEVVTKEIKNQKCIEDMLAWAQTYADNNKYGYKKWTSSVGTHQCPLCHPGSGDGWNCIGFASAILYHGGGAIPQSRCSCSGIIKNNDWATDLAKKEAGKMLETWRGRNGSDWSLVGNGVMERVSGEALLKPGDVVIFYSKSSGKYVYKHVSMYAGLDDQGKGWVYDAMSSTGVSKRLYTAVHKDNTHILVFRYTGVGK